MKESGCLLGNSSDYQLAHPRLVIWRMPEVGPGVSGEHWVSASALSPHVFSVVTLSVLSHVYLARGGAKIGEISRGYPLKNIF